jgi:hypothetical protein
MLVWQVLNTQVHQSSKQTVTRFSLQYKIDTAAAHSLFALGSIDIVLII